MIHVRLADVPEDFDAKVRQPGLRAIAERCGKVAVPARVAGKAFAQAKRKVGGVEVAVTVPQDMPASQFPAIWREALGDLREAYQHVCAYSCFRIHTVTGAGSVDHMAAKSTAWDQVYEWNNYRLACSRLNSRKNDFSDVIDPCDAIDGWFQLELTGFQVVPNPTLDPSSRALIDATIGRLGLDDFRQARADDATKYWEGDISLRTLRLESPFVARELERQGRLNEFDV